MQIHYTVTGRNTYPCRPKAGLHSRTNVVDEDDVADLKVAEWKKTTPVPTRWCLVVPHTYGVDDVLRAPDPAEQRKW